MEDLWSSVSARSARALRRRTSGTSEPRAESAGYDSLWTAEAWGADAFTPLAYLAATTTRLKLGSRRSHRSGPAPRAQRR